MQIHTLAVSNYRSLHELVVPMGALTVVTGANGTGKSSLYRCLRMLAEVASGELVGSISREGGLMSVLWAGPAIVSRRMRTGEVPTEGQQKVSPVRVRLGFAGTETGYSVELGLPKRGFFPNDPEIKREVLWGGDSLQTGVVVASRGRGLVSGIDRHPVCTDMPAHESMLTRVLDPARTPEIVSMRDQLRSWRFYDQLRTDRDAVCRQPVVGTWSPVLSHDGGNVAAALVSLRVCKLGERFDAVIHDAFPGSKVEVWNDGRMMQLSMTQPGMVRPLLAPELSEGTLRFVMLAVALLSPDPAPLVVLNEPEAHLHEDLLPALARLIFRATERSQVWVVTHAPLLAQYLESHPGAVHHVLEKDHGETVLQGQTLLSGPYWSWPMR